MRGMILYLICSIVALSITAYATSIDLELCDKVQYCEVVAEIRVERSTIQTNWDLMIPIPECTCECTIIRLFKGPKELKAITIRTFLVEDKSITYDLKTFVAFIIKPKGHYRPFGGQRGLIEKGHTFFDPIVSSGKVSSRALQYDELIKEIQELTKK